MNTISSARSVERPLIRLALKFIGPVFLASLTLAAQEATQKERLTVTCYWQNFQEAIYLHMKTELWKSACDSFQVPTHCNRTELDMLRDTKRDWEMVKANGSIYTISCKQHCKQLPLEGHSYDAETDGKWMWITFEKPDKRNSVEMFEVTDISSAKSVLVIDPHQADEAVRGSHQAGGSSQTSVNNSEMSGADYENLLKLMQLEPPEFCTAAPLINKAFVAAMGGWKSSDFGGTVTEKMQYDSLFGTIEDKLWKCSHAAAMQNDSSSFQQDLFALALVEQTHLVLRQSALDNAVDSMTVLSPVSPAPNPSVTQRIQAGVQGAANGLNQWVEYRRQLRLARAQNQLHCTTSTWGNTTYTDCY